MGEEMAISGSIIVGGEGEQRGSKNGGGLSVRIDIAVPGLWRLLGSSLGDCSGSASSKKEGKAVAMKVFVAEFGS